MTAFGIKVFGTNKPAAMLEGSKGFTKDLCKIAGIPTAAYGRFHNPFDAKAYVRDSKIPIVVKAGGLAAGKGVVVAATQTEALDAVDNCFSDVFSAVDAEVAVKKKSYPQLFFGVDSFHFKKKFQCHINCFVEHHLKQNSVKD